MVEVYGRIGDSILNLQRFLKYKQLQVTLSDLVRGRVNVVHQRRINASRYLYVPS